MTNSIRLGIDLGGTKTEIIALAPDGNILLRQRVATPGNDYQAIVNCLCSLVEQAQQQLQAGTYTLGLGIPGAISPVTGKVKNANTTCLIGQDLATDLQTRLGAQLAAPIRIANDADCMVLSEASDGAGAGFSSVFGVIIGTGCGGGWVINGQLHRGPNVIAGEWGHNPLPWRSPQDEAWACYCGQQGCIETYVSGPGFARHARAASGQSLTAQQWYQQAQDGDATSQTQVQRYQQWLAQALASVINVMDPEVIVLGGGLSNWLSLYDEVPKLWGQFVFSDQVSTPLRRAQHGDSSGVRGAAWLGGTA